MIHVQQFWNQPTTESKLGAAEHPAKKIQISKRYYSCKFFFFVFNHINYINQTRFFMYIYIIHWYAYLSYISSCILYSFYGCFVYFWLFSAVFGFKKNHCCLRHKIQYMLCSFLGGGGFVDFVFSHVTFIGCFFVYNTVIIRLCNIV